MSLIARCLIRVSGIVQGVGFRPFIYKIASECDIKGWIKNDAQGVLIDAQGESKNIDLFIDMITKDAPPISCVEKISVENLVVTDFQKFEILESGSSIAHNVLISPDISVCADCLMEMNNPDDRRYNYPFINCTNCGPRFSITKSIPYDRQNTVMQKFVMCDKCTSEYQNLADRRFHAQPISCFDCGPVIRLLDNKGVDFETENPLDTTKKLLKNGKIIAIKGIGGYHLSCDATNFNAMEILRTRKHRDAKPFALMGKDLETIKLYCKVSPMEEVLLTSNKRPIVLLEKNDTCTLPLSISSDNSMIGFMLPYTATLHFVW